MKGAEAGSPHLKWGLRCRGGFLFGCCTSTMIKVKEARGERHLPEPTATDANVVDGGDIHAVPKAKV